MSAGRDGEILRMRLVKQNTNERSRIKSGMFYQEEIG